MRLFEALLSLANLLAFFALVMPTSKAIRWIRCAALLAVLIAIAQVLIEGERWEMVPAYVLAYRASKEYRTGNLSCQKETDMSDRFWRSRWPGRAWVGRVHRSPNNSPGVSAASTYRTVWNRHRNL